MGDGACGEMTLDELVGALPEDHRAVRELAKLRDAAKRDSSDGPLNEEEIKEPGTSIERFPPPLVSRCSERVQVASRVLTGLIADMHRLRQDDPQQDAGKLADDALWYADALLARIDETEEKPKPVEQIPQPPPGRIEPHG